MSTVTSKLHVAVFPQTSVAVSNTVVVPTENVEPEGGVPTRSASPLSLDAEAI